MSLALRPFPVYRYPATGTPSNQLPYVRDGVRRVPAEQLTASNAPGFVELHITNKVTGGRSRGISGLLPASAFRDGRVRFHEKTLVPRLERQEKAVLADQGALGKPVLLTAPDVTNLWQRELFEDTATDYRFTFLGQDNDYQLRHLPVLRTPRHTGKEHELLSLPLDFTGPLVIADGHHRAATHARLAARGHDCCAMVPVCIVSGAELSIGTFTRVVEDEREEQVILKLLSELFSITPLDQALPPTRKGAWLLTLATGNYRLHRHPGDHNDLDSEWLDRVVLPHVFGINDTRTAPTLSFAPARLRPVLNRGAAPDQSEASRSESGVVRLTGYPLSVADFFTEVQNGRLFPPKSTLFQPRIPSGLIVYQP